MSLPAAHAIVLDIEGTVGSLTFVRDVLFPYARKRLAPFIEREHDRADVAAALAATADAAGLARDDRHNLIAQLQQWSDEDRKVTPLKTLQGMIWSGGYRSGELRAHLYEDSVRALRRWRAAGLSVYIYSSGSIAAQELYFAHTVFGDLSALIAGYFDTTTGPKQAPESYAAIATAVRQPAEALRFFSDTAAELRAAQAAGMQAVQVRREGAAGDFEPWIASFDPIKS